MKRGGRWFRAWRAAGAACFWVALGWVAEFSTAQVQGREWYVNPMAGNDAAEGLEASPLATPQVAVNRAQAGDTIHLLPPHAVYRATISLRGKTGLTIEGNGVTLTGTEPLPSEGWESAGEGLHRLRLPRPLMDRHLLIVRGRMERMGRSPQQRLEYPPAEQLKPGEFRWDDIEGTREGWLTVRGSLTGLEWGTRANGLATSGTVREVTVRDLNARHCLNDGFNIHGDARGMKFVRISGYENFDEGFSAHDTCECWIEEGEFRGNDNAVADVNLADTYYTRCRFSESISFEVLFAGGRHSLTDCRIEGSGKGGMLSIRTGGAGKGSPPEPAVVRVSGTTFAKARPEAGGIAVDAGCELTLEAGEKILTEQPELISVQEGGSLIVEPAGDAGAGAGQR